MLYRLPKSAQKARCDEYEKAVRECEEEGDLEQANEINALLFEEMEDYIVENLGDKLTLEQQTECVLSGIWSRISFQVHDAGQSELAKYVRSKAQVDKEFKMERDYCSIVLKYLSMCSSRREVIDIMLEYGVGTLLFKPVEYICRFYESEGDAQEGETVQHPVFDLRKAAQTYN